MAGMSVGSRPGQSSIYMSAVAQYLQEQEAGAGGELSTELIMEEALELISLKAEVKKMRQKLDEGSFNGHSQLGFVLGDPKCGEIKHIILVLQTLLDIAESLGLRPYVASLSETFCTSPAEHERATKVMNTIVALGL